MIKNEIKIFLTSVMFYTRIPCPSFIDHSEDYLNKATRYFPLIGIIVGTISFFIFWLSSLIFNVYISVIFSLGAGILITGAFHEDGLADTFDGFGGGWTKDKILEIMKDSRIGTYGIISLITILLLKMFGLTSLFSQITNIYPAKHELLIFLIFITYHSLSRLSAINIVFTSKYSTDDSKSKSKPVAKNNTYVEILISYFWGLLPLIFLSYFIPQFLFVILFIGLLSILSSRYFTKHLDGYTGDCLGAVEQLSEAVKFNNIFRNIKLIELKNEKEKKKG